MKVLLDEDIPKPVVPLVKHLLKGHEVEYVPDLHWAGKKDVPLIGDAARRGFNVFVTRNIGQFNDPAECKAIQRSGMHHVSYGGPSGLPGLGLASGSLCAAILPVITDLLSVRKQQIVSITSLNPGRKRYRMSDPSTDPPSDYWP